VTNNISLQSNIFVLLYNVGTNFTLYVLRIYVFIKEIRRVQASKTNLLAERLSMIRVLLIDPINHV